ncbi:MAG: DnaA N-terminal domain-containing protein [Pseudomonadota bacterium]
MSSVAVNQAMQLKLGRSPSFLLVCLAHHANQQGGNAYPTVERLAAESKMSVRTVQRYLEKFRDDGVLKVEKPARRSNPGGKGGRGTTYRIDFAQAHSKYGLISFPWSTSGAVQELKMSAQSKSRDSLDEEDPADPVSKESSVVTENFGRGCAEVMARGLRDSSQSRWTMAKNKLRVEIPEPAMEKFIEPLRMIEFSDSRIVLEAQSSFHVNWVERNIVHILERLFRRRVKVTKA